MKQKSRILLIMVSVLLCMASAAWADSVVFHDVDASTEAGAAIYKMANMGYVNGIGDGYFAPKDPLTRAQFVKMINQVFHYTVAGENVFTDVSSDQWYYNDILIAQKMGYIQGMGDGTFAPEEYVTREQVCVILHRMMNFAPLPFDKTITDPVSDWAEESVYAVLSNRVFSLEENNTFRATQNITREETCLALAGFTLDELPQVEVPDMNTLAKEELHERMGRVVESLNTYVIPQASTEAVKQVATSVRDNMQSYMADETHDYQSAAKTTYELYKQLSAEEQSELQTLVMDNNWTDDLILLYDFFFPTAQ